MLDELAVHNLGIINEARLEPGPGLTVVTGETGTGKTLLLGALRLIVGSVARAEMIGPHAEEARVDGRFVFGAVDEVAVARRLGPSRSRAYLDGAMAPARAVDERIRGRVEIVGQHDQLSLTQPAELRGLLDRHVPSHLVDAYTFAWDRVRAVDERLGALGGDRRALERELDLVSYQVEEIAGAGFTPGDDVLLERDVSRLRHTAELQQMLAEAREHLDRADGSVRSALAVLGRGAELDPALGELAEAVEGVAVYLADASSESRVQFEALHRDPERLADLEERVRVLGDLCRKYGANLDEVLSFGDRTAKRRDELAALLGSADELEAEREESRAALRRAGDLLRDARQVAGDQISAEAAGHLRDLGFESPVVQITVATADPGPAGADRPRVAFASDSRLALGPVSRVASGGELSRLVLALRLAAGAGTASVVAFDEIDAGIGGATALEMGRKLASLAEGRQVLCVTHLPQVAAFADTHYVVDRTGTTASVRSVDGESRREELSRMLSGLPESDAGREHAEELLRLAEG